jgi:hypothetical protein
MKRISTIILAACSLATALFLAGCGGGGGSTAPANPGSTTATTGQITGFGSVMVNGVKFSRKTGLADDRIKLRFENNTTASEDKLRIGMIVTVRGAVNTSASTGEYESIEFSPELRGGLDNNGVDLTSNRLSIMGRTIQVEANTSFDSVRDLAELNGELQAGRHPELEVSGNMDNSGVFHATRIGRKAADFTSGAVELQGAISATPAPTATGFSIGTRSVVVDNNTVFKNMARADLAANLLVEVKGTLSAGVLTATRIEKKSAVAGQAEDNVNVKGTAASAIVNSAFSLNGPNGPIIVTTATATFLKGGAAATSAIVAAGATLEVEGTLQADGSVKAIKISVEVEKTVKLEGNATAGAYNATANTLTLNGVSVKIAATTRLLDTGGALTLNSIAAGNHLQVTGVVDATGSVSASQVQRTSSSNLTFIQGPVSAKTSTAVTIMGITIDTATITQAGDFQDNRTGTKAAFGATLAEARTAFFAAITTDGLTVVKAKGDVSGTSLSATEVEVEQPL